MNKNIMMFVCVCVVVASFGGYFYQQEDNSGPVKTDSISPSNSPSLSVNQPSEVGEKVTGGLSSIEKVDSQADAVSRNVKDVLRQLHEIFSQRESFDVLTADEQSRLNQLQQELIIYASDNSSIFDEIISIYKADPSSDIGNFLHNVLVHLDESKVENLAKELIDSSQRDSMLAGLKLLSETNAAGADAYQSVERVLSTYPNDNELVLNAVSALPDQLPSNIDVTPVLNSLASLVNNSDDGAIRSESIFSIGRLAKDPESLDVVIEASKSQDLDDRRSAAMVLQNSELVSDEILNHLIERMGDNNEEWEIRRLSADSLNRFELNDSQQGAHRRFRDEQERIARS